MMSSSVNSSISYHTARPSISLNRNAPVLLGPCVNAARTRNAKRYDSWTQPALDQENARSLTPRAYAWSQVAHKASDTAGPHEDPYTNHGSGDVPASGTYTRDGCFDAVEQCNVRSATTARSCTIADALPVATVPDLSQRPREPGPQGSPTLTTVDESGLESPEVNAANILLSMKRSSPFELVPTTDDHGQSSSPRRTRRRRPSKSSEASPTTPVSSSPKQHARSTRRRGSSSSQDTPKSTLKTKPATPKKVVLVAPVNKKRVAAEMSTAVESNSPSSKRKKVSTEAQIGKAWCTEIKFMSPSDLPSFCPPKSKFNGPLLTSSTSEKYNAVRGNSAKVDSKHRSLSAQEQKFIAAFGGRFSEEQYIDCKQRIFVCHRWRTEEDGLNHNIESSQQVCRVDVKVSTTIHKWFDSMHMFDQAWNVSDQTKRPESMGRLQRSTVGRNGRETATKTMNVLDEL